MGLFSPLVVHRVQSTMSGKARQSEWEVVGHTEFATRKEGKMEAESRLSSSFVSFASSLRPQSRGRLLPTPRLSPLLSYYSLETALQTRSTQRGISRIP